MKTLTSDKFSALSQNSNNLIFISKTGSNNAITNIDKQIKWPKCDKNIKKYWDLIIFANNYKFYKYVIG